MSPPAPGGRNRPLWTLPALAVLMVVPVPISTTVLIVGLVLRFATPTVLRAVRGARARRRASQQLAQGQTMQLGHDPRGRPVLVADRQLGAHGLIVGASGSGKTTSLLALLESAIARGQPVVALDLKGSPALAASLARAAAAAGRPCRVFSLDGSERWNPLAHGNPTELKDKLIATERFTEPHYQRAAERYTQLAIGVLQHLHPDRAVTLSEVAAAMEPRRLSALVGRLEPGRAAYVDAYLAALTPDQLSAIRGLGTRLALVVESQAGPLLEPSASGTSEAIDLRRALEGEEVVVFSLNSSVYGKLGAQIGTLAVQDLVAAAGRRLEHPEGAARPRALVGIDEFSGLGSDHVVNLLVRGREAGVSALLCTQELADLERAARGFADQVLGNTALRLIHRQDVPESAHRIAQMVGTEKVWEPTYRIESGLFGRYSTSSGTRREVDRFIVHPNEIKALRTGEALLITKVPQSDARMVRVAPPGSAGRASTEPRSSVAEGISSPPGREAAAARDGPVGGPRVRGAGRPHAGRAGGRPHGHAPPAPEQRAPGREL